MRLLPSHPFHSILERYPTYSDHRCRRFLGQQPTPLWQRLDLAWKTFTERVTKAEHLESGDIQTLLTLARFTRNLVAGVAENQVEAFNFEPYIRSAIRYLTSWTMLQREEVRQLTRFLVQALSNIVTSNPELSSSLWQSYMRDAEDSNLFLRILVVEDIKGLIAGFVLLLNVTNGSRDSLRLLVETKAGRRVADKLLTRMAILLEAPEGSEEAQACDIGYQFIKQVFEHGLAVDLYEHIAQEGEPVMANQRILLKLFDGYLQSPTMETSIEAYYARDIPKLYLIIAYKSLKSIKTSLETAESPDGHLPVLSEALVLVAQCCQALLLREATSTHRPILQQMRIKRIQGQGTVEVTIDVLRELNVLLPRIEFGKSVPSPFTKGMNHPPEETDPMEFPYLKRDLIRLLGTMVYKDKGMQDRVRACGGVEVVMSHCVIDDRNPCM